MSKPIAVQLHEAWDKKKLTLEQILDLVRKDCQKRGRPNPLDCDFTSLSRKLRGKQGMTEAEAEVLARVLDVDLDWSGVEFRIA